jgi:hypothetical protein
MERNIASQSNAYIGKAFNAISKEMGRNDLGEILYNWNESQLNLVGDKIIGYPGRDGIFSRGKEGGKVNISKKEFLNWLISEKPLDEKIYGVNIRNNTQWTGLIQRAREILASQNG